jgi:chromosome partitioning protein
VSLSSILRKSCVPNLMVAPSSKDLVSIELELGKTPGRELILKSEIALLTSHYDYIIVDCPPSSGLLTLNALGACEHVLIPLQAEYYALEGISGLLGTIKFVQGTFNPRLSILGVFLTMYDARTNLSTQVEAEAANHFGTLLLEERIPRNIRLSEAPSHGLPIGLYAPQSAGAVAYKRLTAIIIDRCIDGTASDKVANG